MRPAGRIQERPGSDLDAERCRTRHNIRAILAGAGRRAEDGDRGRFLTARHGRPPDVPGVSSNHHCPELLKRQ
jgi:hypothetical protein